jgi:hypothetical protein
MDTEQKKSPSPWLGPSLTMVAILVAVVWAYIQMQHWRDPEADYVAMAENLAITLGLLTLLIVAIFRNFRDAKRAGSLRAQIVSIKEDYELRLRNKPMARTDTENLPQRRGTEQPQALRSMGATSAEIQKLDLELGLELARLQSRHSAQEVLVTIPAQSQHEGPQDKQAPIAFGDAVQGINPRNEKEAECSWWHIPVTANEELRFCKVQLQLDTSRNFEMLWSVGHGDKPSIRIDLAPNDTIRIPIAARCESDGALTGHPNLLEQFRLSRGVALLTDDQVISHNAAHQYHVLQPGEHLLQITVITTTAPTRSFLAWYELYIPQIDISNGHFYMRLRSQKTNS